MADLFDSFDPPVPRHQPPEPGRRPLADRLRPTRLADVLGQNHLLAAGGPLAGILEGGHLRSTILWGPPGVGKTTLARLLAAESGMAFEEISAIFTGTAELKKLFEAARLRHSQGRQTLLFVDEIHRFNKAQQDGFLPHMEAGRIVLVGATTENPSFELNAALLSRAQVLVLNRLDADAMEAMLARAEAAFDQPLPLTPSARTALIDQADGDGRALLNAAEQAFEWRDGPVDVGELSRRLTRRAAQYDKSGDAHYNLISALHKSVRGSDPDAALYWFCRMLEGGEDPRYLARRLARMAVEDIALADPDALPHALAAWECYERLGSPEGELALANTVIYLATAPKSNAAYVAYKAARQAAKETGSLVPPKAILNAPTRMMKEMGYGQGYDYANSFLDQPEAKNHFPEGMEPQTFYAPTHRGHEGRVRGNRSEPDDEV